MGYQVVDVHHILHQSAAVSLEEGGPCQLFDVELCLLQVALHLTFQHKRPFRQVTRVDVVVEECHILLAHLCIERDVHASWVDGVGHGEVHIGLSSDTRIGGAQREPRHADACCVEHHRSFHLCDVQAACLSQGGMSDAQLRDSVCVEDRVDGPVDMTDVHVTVVHELRVVDVAHIRLVRQVEHQSALVPTEGAHLIAALLQIDASVFS